MISIWQIQQDISDLEGHKMSMSDEGKDAADRVMEDLRDLLELVKNFKYSIKE